MIGAGFGQIPLQDDWYRKSVFLVLGLQDFGLLMVGSRLRRYFGAPRWISGNSATTKSRVWPLVWCYLLSYFGNQVSGYLEFSVVEWLTLLVSCKLDILASCSAISLLNYKVKTAYNRRLDKTWECNCKAHRQTVSRGTCVRLPDVFCLCAKIEMKHKNAQSTHFLWKWVHD